MAQDVSPGLFSVMTAWWSDGIDDEPTQGQNQALDGAPVCRLLEIPSGSWLVVRGRLLSLVR
jgi:hypothetical protein